MNFKKLFATILLVLFTASWVHAESVKQTISAAPATGTWTASLMPDQSGSNKGFINVGISGVTPSGVTPWVATVTLQRAHQDDYTAWYNVYTWTADTERAFIDFEANIIYRIGIHINDYTSGTVNVKLSK